MSSVREASDPPEFDVPWYTGKSYQLLVKDGARRVHAGEYAIEDLGIHPERLNAPEEEHDACIEQFHSDVESFIDAHTLPETTQQDSDPDPDPARTADSIAWARVFEEFNFHEGNTGVSRTQLRGALAVSDHTTFGPDADDARAGNPETLDAVITDALHADVLMDVGHRPGYIDLVGEVSDV